MGLFFKFVSIIVMIAMTFLFTGLSATASAAFFEKSEKSCCDECNKGVNPNSVDCSTPECPMFLCLSINTVPPFMPLNFLGSVYIHQPVEELRLELSVKSIFHPPTIV
jgi:hypothetical protein